MKRKDEDIFDKLLIMSCFNQLEKQTEIPQINCMISHFDIYLFLFGIICFMLEHCPQFKLGLLIQTPWNPTQMYYIYFLEYNILSLFLLYFLFFCVIRTSKWYYLDRCCETWKTKKMLLINCAMIYDFTKNPHWCVAKEINKKYKRVIS